MSKPRPPAENEEIDRKFKDRHDSSEQVRKRLRSGWRNDPAVLNQYFQSAYNNWKVYNGPRTPKQVLKLQSIYKQATYGDCTEPEPEDMHTLEGQKWEAWAKLKGMDEQMAKRRFITFLMEIDPSLIDVMPDERPPVGFPLDRKGNPLCAKCNTVVGCSRPLLDQRKMNLRQQLFEHEEFHESEKLKEWIRNALIHQRCVWGLHQAISKVDSKPFTDWFNRDENRGFFPYDSISLMEMVKDLVEHYHEVVFEMMAHKQEVDALQYNAMAIKAVQLKKVYEEFSAEEYQFEVLCSRDNESCNMRRVADGRNHKHAVIIDPPTASNANNMEEAIALRIQCQKLGLNPSTGVVKSIEQRCDIYRERIAAHMEAVRKAGEAKVRNDARAGIHRKQKDQVQLLAKEILEKQCIEACQANQCTQVLTAVQRGANPNTEGQRGINPMLCMLLNAVGGEKMEDLLRMKADINLVNKHGLTPLMMAARLKDVRAVHVLMKNGAAAIQKGSSSRTVLHHCAIHHSEEIVRVLIDYLKEGIGDSMRVIRFIDAVDDEGETALMTAATIRNGLMCHLLLQFGANPNVRNRHGRTAMHAARNNGWAEIADWLEKKVGADAMKVASYSDIQFEKQSRFGFIKTQELVQQFGKTYLHMVLGRHTMHPFGCPFTALANGKTAKEQRGMVDNHQRYVLNRAVENYPGMFDLKGIPHEEERAEKRQVVEELRKVVEGMYDLVKGGYTNPNTEAIAQPLPWTPLMCAVAVSDIRIVRLLLREGANPNYPNKDGTTAVMLAAQLQDADMLVELLKGEGDLEAVDNQGYTAQAYANSFPLPTFMDRDMVEMLLDDDVRGPKCLTTNELIKSAANLTVIELKELLLDNKSKTDPESVERHALFLNLLSQYGLSRMNNAANVFYNMKTVDWRLSVADAKSADAEQKEAEQDAERLAELEHERLRQEEAEEMRRLASEPPRCPVCTLHIPCAHFFKLETLLQFISKNTVAGQGSPMKHLKKGKIFKINKKLRALNRIQELLEETQLADRHTDRSLALAGKYQAKEEQLEAEKEQRKKLALLALPAPSEEQNVMLEVSSGDYEEVQLGSLDIGAEFVEPADNSTALVVVPPIEDSSVTEQPVEEVSEPSAATLDLVPFDAEALALLPLVPILKPTSAPDSRSVTVSRKRRVKFDLPGMEDDDAFDFADADEPLLQITDGSAADQVQGGDSTALVVLPTDLPSSGEVAMNDNSASYENTMTADVKNAITVFQEGAILHDDGTYDPNQTAGPRRLMMFSKQPPSPTKKSMKITLSGWIYVHLAPLEADLIPLETLSISQAAWCALLEHIHQSYESTWHTLHLCALVNGKSWQVDAPRCVLCNIGYVRNVESIAAYLQDKDRHDATAAAALKCLAHGEASSENGINDHICFSCLIRRELHGKISQSLPRMLRKSFPSKWPVLSANFIKKTIDSDQAAGDMLAIANQSINSTHRKEMQSPLVSTQMMQLDLIEARRSPPKPIDVTNVSILSDDDFSTDSGATFSSFSTLSITNANIKPKEIQMLAYLLFKGQYEDAERTIRIALNKVSINEGEGLLYTCQLMCMQADMYKLLGLYVLALSIYIDLVDMACVLVGMSNSIAQRAFKLLLVNYYRFHLSEEADKYHTHYVDKMNNELRSQPSKDEITKALKQSRRVAQNETLEANAVYINLIKPHLDSASTIRSKFQTVLGIAAVYTLYSSQQPHILSLRKAFLAHCQGVFLEFAEFVDICFQLRLCDDEEVKRLFVQHILHKHLSQDSLLLRTLRIQSDSPSPEGKQTKKQRKHNSHTNSDLIVAIKQYLSHGRIFPVQLLDTILHAAMKKLTPCYANFFMHHADHSHEEVEILVAEAVDISVTLIQCRIRCCLARWKVQKARDRSKELAKISSLQKSPSTRSMNRNFSNSR